MVSEYLEFSKRAIAKVKRLWHLYILGKHQKQLEEELNLFPDDLLMIGTGRHEMYQTKEEFLFGRSEDSAMASNIQFEMPDEWYEVKKITDTVCVVYGSLWAREKAKPGQSTFVDMEGSRFTMVCRDTGDGVDICSIHHSMPYVEQGEGEYYPKKLSLRVKELEQKAELDSMTGLYNRYSIEQHISTAMNHTDGCFFALDLDDFKNINDTMGHLVGDQVIVEFSAILRSVASPSALLGRMGGDEFSVWDAGIKSRGEAEGRVASLLAACEQLTPKLGIKLSCSTGIVFFHRDCDSFIELYQRADKALYRAKSQGKSQLSWADED